VPFYKYAELYAEIEDVMKAKQAPIYDISFRGMSQVSSRLVT
jgi:fatty acid desaturase